MPFKYFKEEAKLINWGKELKEESNLSMEELAFGCVLRIADSLEKMEQPYIELLQDSENYKYLENENKKLKRTLAGLKGYINRLNSPSK